MPLIHSAAFLIGVEYVLSKVASEFSKGEARTNPLNSINSNDINMTHLDDGVLF